MKTIATAAVILTLATAAWADEPANDQKNDPAATDAPIILSEAEMDGVTAGAWYAKFDSICVPTCSSGTSSGSYSAVGGGITWRGSLYVVDLTEN